jgi:hypothetical protein
MPARPPSARMVSSTLTSALAALMGRTVTFKTSRILLASTSLMWIVTPGRGPKVLAGFVVSVVLVLPSSGFWGVAPGSSPLGFSGSGRGASGAGAVFAWQASL